jgi:hypothetical protein
MTYINPLYSSLTRRGIVMNKGNTPPTSGKVRIVSKMDKQTCDVCKSRHGTIADLENAELNDLPPFHNNKDYSPCRCVVEPDTTLTLKDIRSEDSVFREYEEYCWRKMRGEVK